MTEPIYQPRKPAETFEGKPCIKCGNTLRYATHVSKACVACRKRLKLQWSRSPNGKNTRKNYQIRYRQQRKGRLAGQRYNQSTKAKIVRQRYRQTAQGKAVRQVDSNKRHAQRRNVVGSYTAQEWRDLKERFDNRCLCCKRHQSELDRVLEQDHIIPITKRGTNWITNIQPLCHDCNGMGGKGTKIIDYRF